MSKKYFYILFSLMIALVYFGCAKDSPDAVNSPEELSKTDAFTGEDANLEKHASGVNAVYTQSNSPSGNEVLMYYRTENGTLDFAGSFPTGGTGTGAGLGSQGAVVLYRNFLFVVNAGSNEISVFRVGPSGLTLLDTESSEGQMPISVTVHKNLLYVLNAGGSGNIAGFRLSVSEGISFIQGSIRPLSSSASNPAQIQFTPAGDRIVVTEKATNLILTYKVQNNGTTSGPQTHPSSGITPFGFEFDHKGHLIVSEAFNGATGEGTMSSYSIFGGLNVISASVPNFQTAPCWVVVTKNGKYTYTTNTGSGTISGYYIRNNGELVLFNDGGVTAFPGAGSAPIDMALSNNSRYLYNVNSGVHSITGYRVNNDGTLSPIETVRGLPPASVGMAAN